MRTKEEKIMDYLMVNVFKPILDSNVSSPALKRGVRTTIMRLNQLDATGMVKYYWSAIIGTERSTRFATQMKEEGFLRFEELLEDFREKFNDRWLRTN